VILYLDTSALVKRYLAESGSAMVNQWIADAAVVGTALISRAEMASALAKAARMGALTPDEALASLQAFRQEWSDFIQVQITQTVVARADSLAWDHNLRGYDAVQLAAALYWQESLHEPVTMATFDQRLWAAVKRVGLTAYPTFLPL
jgi:predicted nucleic acid-binding protein